MARVATQPRADVDITEIVRYVRREAGAKVAENYRLDFRAAFRRLSDFPESGAPRPGLGRGVRIVTIHPYVILHRYDRVGDTVFVLRILHGRRRLALDAP